MPFLTPYHQHQSTEGITHTDKCVKSFFELYFSSTESESVPLQLAQCWYPGLAIFSGKIFFK